MNSVCLDTYPDPTHQDRIPVQKPCSTACMALAEAAPSRTGKPPTISASDECTRIVAVARAHPKPTVQTLAGTLTMIGYRVHYWRSDDDDLAWEVEGV